VAHTQVKTMTVVLRMTMMLPSILAFVLYCFRYKHMDMLDLETKLMEAEEAGAKVKLIATDGVFSMDGVLAAQSAV